MRRLTPMVKANGSTLDTSHAIARVLQAEAEARDAVAKCERDAQRVVQTAKARARAISDRADARIASAHTALAGRVAADVERLEAEGAALEAKAGDSPDSGRLAAAVAALAAELTGAAR